jgi:hypothetical protein
MMSMTPLPSRLVAVYELMNLTRMESALVISCDDENEMRARLQGPLPPALSRWNSEGDVLSAQTLAPGLKEGLAEEFVKSYLENMRMRTWRFHVWRT